MALLQPKEDFLLSANKNEPNIVLIDINKVVQEEKAKFVKKNMYKESYIYLSYGVATLHSWAVFPTENTTKIVTLSLACLIVLCRYIQREPDLKHIQYLWLDTISLQQPQTYTGNKRLEHLQQIKHIYDHATYILAVPDIHDNVIDNHSAELRNLAKYARHFYHYIIKPEEALDSQHMEDLNSRLFITWILEDLDPSLHDTFHPQDLLYQLSLLIEEADPSSSFSSSLFYTSLKKALLNVESYSRPYIWYFQSYFDIHYQRFPNDKPRKPNDPNSIAWKQYYTPIGQAPSTNLSDLIDRLKIWKNKYEEWQSIKEKGMKHFSTCIYTWLRRSWTICEYHSIHHYYDKPRFKLIFISLLSTLQHGSDPLYTSFFHLFHRQWQQQQQIPTVSTSFLSQIENRMMHRCTNYLQGLINPYDSYWIDRFYITFSFWEKYKTIVVKIIEEWNINEPHSFSYTIPYKLYDILDLEDKIKLLHACSMSGQKYPSFAIQCRPEWVHIKQLHLGQYHAIDNLQHVPELELIFSHYKNKKHNNSNNVEEKNEEEEEEKEERMTSSVKTPIPLYQLCYNITCIQFQRTTNVKNDRLMLSCDVYYKVDYFVKPVRNTVLKEQKAELIIIPLYRPQGKKEKHQYQKVITPCFIPLKRDIDGSEWEVYRVNSMPYNKNNLNIRKIIAGVSVDDGICFNGQFCIK